MEDEIGWLWVHGTSAGCASIIMWEGLAGLMSGPILMITFGAITFVSLHVVARHHRKLARRVPVVRVRVRADGHASKVLPRYARGGRSVRRLP